MKLCYVGDEGRVGLFSEECQQIICEVSIVEESGSTVQLVLTQASETEILLARCR